MPLEPLNTDEAYTGPAKAARDMDSQMLAGCSAFVFASIGGYVLSVWPWFFFDRSELVGTLGLCLAVGLGPAAILGGVMTRRAGIAGACGFVGGAMTTGVFMVLRLQQVFLASRAREAPRPDYPETMIYLIPVGWILVALLLGVALLPRGELPED